VLSGTESWLQGVRRGDGRQRLRPLRTCNSSKHWKKAQKLRREHSSHQIDRRERSGPLIFTSREKQEERTEEEIISHRISLRYPSAIGSGEDAWGLASGVSTQEERILTIGS
jgi:hypothetical protein